MPSSHDPQGKNPKAGSAKSWFFRMTPKGPGIIVQPGSQDQAHQEVPVDIRAFTHIFNRHPFPSAIIRSIDRDIEAYEARGLEYEKEAIDKFLPGFP